jgi:hypothetical protein
VPSLSSCRPPSPNTHDPTWQPACRPISFRLLSLLTCAAVHGIHKWRKVPPHLMTSPQMFLFFELLTSSENLEWIQIPGCSALCVHDTTSKIHLLPFLQKPSTATSPLFSFSTTYGECVLGSARLSSVVGIISSSPFAAPVLSEGLGPYLCAFPALVVTSPRVK